MPLMKTERTVDYVFRGCRVILTELVRREDGYRIEVVTTSVTESGAPVADRYETVVRYDFAEDFSSCSELSDGPFTASEGEVKDRHIKTVGRVLEDDMPVKFHITRRDDLLEREETAMLYGEWQKRTTLEWRGRSVEVRTSQAKNAVNRYQTTVREGRKVIEKRPTVYVDDREAEHEAAVSAWIAILARSGGVHE